MADTDHITLRSVFATQALATMGVDPEWDRKLSAYLRLDTLQHADAEFGANAAANERFTLDGMLLESKYGENYRVRPECRQIVHEGDEVYNAAEKAWQTKFLEPFWQATHELALTPAPTLAAALLKVAMIDREDLGRVNMPRDLMEVVTEDMNRVAEGEV